MNSTYKPQSQIVRRFVIIFGLISIALVTMSVPTAGSPSYDVRFTSTASIPNLPLNNGFESGSEPWRITWHMSNLTRNDQVLCDGENGKPRGNNSDCGFVFRGSARENTSLSQSFNLPAGSAITGDSFNVCLDYKTNSAKLNLNVTLTLTSNTATTLTSKIFARSFQRTRADYETICSPAKVLPQTYNGGEITFRFRGEKGTKVFIDNVSLKRNRLISPTNTLFPTSMTDTFTEIPTETLPTHTPSWTFSPIPTQTHTPDPNGPTRTPIGTLIPTACGGGEC